MTVARSKDVLGRRGEDLAAALLIEKGYVVLARNWRSRTGELDIVARDGSCVVFVEVKTRSTDLFGLPAEAITTAKLGRIRRLAAEWLAAGGRDTGGEHAASVRFDAIAITMSTPPRIEHLIGVQ